MKQSNTRHIQQFEVLTHLIGWGILIGFPFFFFGKNGEPFHWAVYLRHCVVPVFFLIVFYLNYFVLIPTYLFNEQVKKFLVINLVLIIVISLGLHLWQMYSYMLMETSKEATKHHGPPAWVFYTRDLLSLILTAALSVAIKMTGHWMRIENARREAEKARTEAELKNLRNQLNPHFLLNTLNNIYALIAFDSDKAQLAVQELSKLLRYVLYDNQQTFVPLGREMDFIRNYIELMRIRLTPNVTVETQINIPSDSQTQIAPLIFISLIENAFKHGISPTEPSFIYISFSDNGQEVTCHIQNSHHPKSETDKSGSGIGLEQVSKRLELLYPGRYRWNRGISPDGKTYSSDLSIQTGTDTEPFITNP